MKVSRLVAWFSAIGAITADQIPLNGKNLGDTEQEIGAYQVFRSTHTEHSIRIKKHQIDDSVCDARSAQYTGWLDVDHKHIFFWYFDSRTSPDKDPLVLWLTGGPGSSSMIALFSENLPCLINDHVDLTVHNEYCWNK